MKYYKHILACLDLSGMDIWIIRYAAFLADIVEAEKLTFIHVIQTYDIPEQQKRSGQIRRELKEYVEWKVKEHTQPYDLSKTHIETEVVKENRDASQVIIDYIRKNDVDVTTLGKKADMDRKELYSGRIMAYGESDMLLVPLSPHHKIDHILTALDFSPVSAKAFKLASQIADYTKSYMGCHLLFKMPKIYFPLTPRQSIARYVEKKGKRRMERFLKKHARKPAKITRHVEVTDYNKQAVRLMEKANATEANLVVVGAQGKTSSHATLLGFVAEEVRKYKSPVPVLVVKNPLEKNNFWNLLLGG
ncbi:MAG: universal stress protein [Bacteroidales bacterium]|nr:universal stress protein [Bacteroidales bacterium]MCF8333213.1 universal stress protein [Bacteroidales bacterium]